MISGKEWSEITPPLFSFLDMSFIFQYNGFFHTNMSLSLFFMFLLPINCDK